jgi:hypothetical protein
VSVALPEGLSGNPEAVPKCARDTFDAVVNNDGTTRCPVASQVGIAEIGFWYGTSATVAVLNIEPRPGDVADFGFVIVSTPVHIIPTLDPASNYALKASLNKVPQVLPIVSSRVTLWGVPSDPSHDPQRICAGQPYIQGPCSIKDVTPQAFLTNPSSCMGPQRSRVTIASWQGPNALASADYTTAAGITGCDQLRFEPSSGVRTTTERGDAPTGLAVDLAFPQTTDPAGFGSPPLRTATVALPEGLTINPGSADGLQACSDAQLGLKSDAPIGCPEAAKIGTATVHTPVLSELLTGTVYLRTQNSDDPESGEMFRLALLLKSEARGLLMANKDTGRLTAVFADNPQLPVSSISLELKSGPRAPLATPPACGPHNVQTTLASWAEQSVTADATINVACTPELGRFAPTFSAGSVNPVAGASSSFGLSIVKPDGNAAVNGLTMTLPTGLLARLKGNLNTQVGSVTAYAGPGTNPFALPGKVFLEGQYGDAPFSLRAVVPAKAGPFDLGEVVVRQKIYVDPIDGHVTVVSDPIPTIVKGVPVRLQRLDVNVD